MDSSQAEVLNTLSFSNGNQARVLWVSQEIAAGKVIQGLALPQPRALIVLNGGTAELEIPRKTILAHMIQDGLAHVAAEEDITLLTGGTNAGIFALLGQGLARWGRKAPCIGIAVADLVDLPAANGQQVALEPHHSHFVLVQGHQWGDETRLMLALAGALGRNCPSLALVAGGGDIVLQEMFGHVQQERPLLLLAGSGRITDAVLSAHAGKTVLDSRIMNIAQRGEIIPFDVQHGPVALATLIEKSLFKHRR